MIKSKEVDILITNRNINYYRDFIKDIKTGLISIKIENLYTGSKVKILTECDICNRIKELSYDKYLKNISRGGFYACSNKCAVIKGENTCLKKYGTKYALQNEVVKENLREYFIDRFGYDNPSKNIEVQNRRDNTMMERFGVKTNIILPETHKKAVESSMSDESIKKRSSTMMERFGVDNPTKSKEIYDKIINTNLERFGCEFPAQNSEIFDKTQKAQFKMKIYKDLRYQGTYELDFLKYCEDNKILEKISKIKSIKYNFNGKDKFYHPDFYIKKLNLIVEIKSDYYYKLYLDKNLSKQKSCLDKGYDFMFIINKDYSEFIEKIKTI